MTNVFQRHNQETNMVWLLFFVRNQRVARYVSTGKKLRIFFFRYSADQRFLYRSQFKQDDNGVNVVKFKDHLY